MKDVKSVDFVFENCEVISFKSGYLYEFSLDDIKESIHRIGINMISHVKSSDCCMIILSKNANVGYKPFGVEDWDEEKIFDRICSHHDITYFTVNYTDGTSENIYIKYKEESESLGAPNVNMDTCINDDGHLFITICPDKKINDLFDSDDLKKGAFSYFEKFEDCDADDEVCDCEVEADE